MEIYDNDEEGDDDSDDGIEVEDDDDDEKEESLPPVSGAGSSTGTCAVTFRTLYRVTSLYSVLPCMFVIWTYFSLVILHYVCIMLKYFQAVSTLSSSSCPSSLLLKDNTHVIA